MLRSEIGAHEHGQHRRRVSRRPEPPPKNHPLKRKERLSPIELATDDLTGVPHLSQDAVDWVGLGISFGVTGGMSACTLQFSQSDFAAGLTEVRENLRPKRFGHSLEVVGC